MRQEASTISMLGLRAGLMSRLRHDGARLYWDSSSPTYMGTAKTHLDALWLPEPSEIMLYHSHSLSARYLGIGSRMVLDTGMSVLAGCTAEQPHLACYSSDREPSLLLRYAGRIPLSENVQPSVDARCIPLCT